MVALDYQLLYCARKLVNGANVHHLGELIFAYEQAVALHNKHLPTHEIYRIQSELRLREYVHKSQDEIISTVHGDRDQSLSKRAGSF